MAKDRKIVHGIVCTVFPQIFYAFASGVPYPLHRELQHGEMYSLLGWQHWVRAVAKTFNAKTATANAGLIAFTEAVRFLSVYIVDS